MAYTERFTEHWALMGGLYADNRAAGVYNTAWMSAESMARIVVLINVGELAQGATFDCLLQEAVSVGGVGAQAIAGKAITQLTQAGGDGNDWLAIELRAEEFDVADDMDFVRAHFVVANAAVDFSCMVFGETEYRPPATDNWTEIID